MFQHFHDTKSGKDILEIFRPFCGTFGHGRAQNLLCIPGRQIKYESWEESNEFLNAELSKIGFYSEYSGFDDNDYIFYVWPINYEI